MTLSRVLRAVGVLVFVAGVTACIDRSVDGPTRMFRVDAARSGSHPAPPVAASGTIVWTLGTGSTVRSSPVLSGDLLLVGSGNTLEALDATTGRRRWRYRSGTPISSSAAVRGRLAYIMSRGNTVIAVDLSNGQRRWHAQTGADVPWPWGHEGWDYFTSSPLVVGDLVIVGSGDGNVYAFAAHTGDERWRAETGGRVRASPSYADSTVYVGSTDGVFYALDLATGAVRWTYETEGAGNDAAAFGFDRKSIQSSAAVDERRVYFGSRDGGLYALDRTTGALAWRADHGTSWIVGSPALADGRVCVGGSDGQFVECVDRETGRELWRVSTGARVLGSPAVAGDLLFVGSHAGTLDAYAIADGTRRWALPLGDVVMSSPELRDSMLYVGTDGGAVHGIRLTGGPPPARLVYWDEARLPWNLWGWHETVRDYYAARGYPVGDRAALVAFMEARIRDSVPSVVVFAMDDFPHTAGVAPSDTMLGRRYLDAGGKIVWFGYPPLLVRRNAEGAGLALDRDAVSAVLGVDFSDYHGDRYGVYPSAAGRRWGLRSWFVGSSGVANDQVTEVLGRSEGGGAGAWVKSYGGPPGTGFIWLGVGEAPLDFDLLRESFRVAEQGIGREFEGRPEPGGGGF